MNKVILAMRDEDATRYYTGGEERIDLVSFLKKHGGQILVNFLLEQTLYWIAREVLYCPTIYVVSLSSSNNSLNLLHQQINNWAQRPTLSQVWPGS